MKGKRPLGFGTFHCKGRICLSTIFCCISIPLHQLRMASFEHLRCSARMCASLRVCVCVGLPSPLTHRHSQTHTHTRRHTHTHTDTDTHTRRHTHTHTLTPFSLLLCGPCARQADLSNHTMLYARFSTRTVNTPYIVRKLLSPQTLYFLVDVQWHADGATPPSIQGMQGALLACSWWLCAHVCWLFCLHMHACRHTHTHSCVHVSF